MVNHHPPSDHYPRALTEYVLNEYDCIEKKENFKNALKSKQRTARRFV